MNLLFSSTGFVDIVENASRATFDVKLHAWEGANLRPVVVSTGSIAQQVPERWHNLY